MVIYNWMQPRQRLLMLLLLFLFQVAVKSWKFTKQNARIALPKDYPLNLTFYRLPVIPSLKDIEENSAIEYSMEIRRSDGKDAPENWDQFVELDKDTGELKLVKNFPLAANRGKKRHRLFENATISGKSRNKKTSKKLEFLLQFFEIPERERQDTGRIRHRLFENFLISGNTKKKNSSKQFEILVEVADSLDNYCNPTLSTCFPSTETEYAIPEDVIVNSTFDYLMNPSLSEVCPNISLHYAVHSAADVLSVNSNTGALQLNSEVDVDTPSSTFLSENHSMKFNVTCQAGKENFSVSGRINFTDVNDNPPTTYLNESSVYRNYSLEPNQDSIKIHVEAWDRDSENVNNMKLYIRNDTLNLFKEDYKVYLYNIRGPHNGSYYGADVKAKNLLKAPFTEYNFTIVIEDIALQQKDRQLIFYINLTKKINENIQLEESYEVNISRKAQSYSRILQLTTLPHQFFNFSLANWKEHRDWLSITNKSGIVFIRNRRYMPKESKETRKILWWKKNSTHEISGTSILIINIYEAPRENCSFKNYCNFYASSVECEMSCGNGSVSGYCTWRQGSYTKSPNTKYSACTPDLDTCPDGLCDEIEEMEPSICPLDCSRKTRSGLGYLSTSGRGIQMAIGRCFCLETFRCTCSRYAEELKLAAEYQQLNFSYERQQRTEVQNISIIDAGKRIIFGEDETSTSVVIIPVTGFNTNGSCGVGCVILASMLPFVILILVILIIIVRRIRNNKLINHLKVGGSRISLSAVPSDYVQDRPNSRQDSRTASEASSAKSVLYPKWEFPRNRLQFQSILGEGEFGKVVKAQALNIAGQKGLTTVAVKMLKDNGGLEEMQDLVSEFTLLKDISHPNVIKLLGACTEKGGPFYLIVEYAEMGSLRSYLRKRRKHNNCCKHNATYGIEDLTAPQQPAREYYQFMCERSRYEPRHCFFHKEQMSYAWQISKGMAYLAGMKLVHRDLAARNVLLNKRKVAKISDFGLSRDVYKGEAYLKKTKGRVPVKWMAIESLEDQIYTSRSDVWSFGIVIWEIMTQGATPYPGVTPQRLFNLLKAGYRMSKPAFCPDELYQIMRQCWQKAPSDRPSFKELVRKLDGLLQDTVEYMDFDIKDAQSNQSSSREAPLLSFDDLSGTTLQYTSVLVENDEEFSDIENMENIGLVNLFSEGGKDAQQKNAQEAPDDKESPA